MSFKSEFESRERESQFNTAGGSKFHVRGAAELNDRLANGVRRNGTRSRGTDDDRVLRALARNAMCLFLLGLLERITIGDEAFLVAASRQWNTAAERRIGAV